MSVDLKIPEVGESIVETQIGKWSVSEGDQVEKDQTLVEIETDKVTVELPSPVSGKLSKITKQTGEKANVGDVIAQIEEGAAGDEKEEKAEKSDKSEKAEKSEDQSKQPAQKQEKTEEKQPEKKEPQKQDNSDQQPRVMPAAQRLMDEKGLDASQVKGTGPGGRILKEDVARQPKQEQAQPQSRESAPAETAPKAAAKAPQERAESVVAMTPLRARIAQRLVEAQQTAALLTTFNEIDMSAVVAMRQRYQEDFQKKHGVKLGFMSFFVMAAIDALKQFPQVNAEVREQNIVHRNYYDIGIAVGTPRGLVVPVLRDAHQMNMAEIEKEIAAFGEKAKNNKLKLEDLEGGTFTISNGGIYGSMLSTPIVNPPQSGILGLHAIEDRPIAVDKQVVIRPMMYVALTYDHRIVDGREAVTFLKRIKQTIEDPARLLIDA